jgi:hypothetical protein
LAKDFSPKAYEVKSKMNIQNPLMRIILFSAIRILIVSVSGLKILAIDRKIEIIQKPETSYNGRVMMEKQ